MCGTLHFRFPLCNIVSLPVATVVARKEPLVVIGNSDGDEPPPQGVIEFLEQWKARVFGMHFSHAADIPEHNGGMRVLAWYPYMVDGLA